MRVEETGEIDLHENIREEKRHPNLFRYFGVIKKDHNNGFLLN